MVFFIFLFALALVIGGSWIEAYIIVWIASLMSISIEFRYVFFIVLIINIFSSSKK